MSVNFYGKGDLRYGYFWPYPNANPSEKQIPAKSTATYFGADDYGSEAANVSDPSLEDINREMEMSMALEDRATLIDVPVFAVTADRVIVLNANDTVALDKVIIEEIDNSWE